MKKKLVALLMTATMAAALTACGSGSSTQQAAATGSEETAEEPAAEEESAEPEAGEEEPAEEAAASGTDIDTSELVFAFAPPTMNNPFYLAVEQGIKDMMTENGMDPEKQLITVDAESDQNTMNNFIYDLINQEISALIMAPTDCTACTEALQACADANIPVINVDTKVDRDDLVISVINSDNYQAGVLDAQDMMGRLDEGSKICIMNKPAGTACVERENGFLETVGDYFEVIGTYDTKADTATTLSVAEDVITSDADIAGFFAINDMAALGCVQACAASNRDDILIYGVDGNPNFMGYVEDSSATASAAQQPSVVGKNAVTVALDYLSGKEVEKEIVIPVELITFENVGNYDISDWQ